MNKTQVAEEDLYNQRLKRIRDTVELKKPDREPFILEFGYLAARYSGIKYDEMVYDPLKCVKAHEKIVTELEPDAFHCIPFDSGPTMEAIGTRAVKQPGHELKPNGSYIMCHSTSLDDAKIENVVAMIEATREFGVYR